MAAFDKYTNYTEKTSFSGVVTGDKKPFLEVEMNEVQEIMNTKLKRVVEAIGGKSIFPVGGGSISFSSDVVSVTGCVVLAEQLSAYIESASFTLDGTNTKAVAVLEEVDADYTTALKEYGLIGGTPMTNPILDVRTTTETTRRKLVTVTLQALSSVPSDTDTKKYVVIGEVSGGSFSIAVNDRVSKLEKQMGGLTFRVSDGVLYVDYEE